MSKTCVIVDIDGTLSNAEHRIDLIPRNEPDRELKEAMWQSFHDAAVSDGVFAIRIPP